MTTTSLSSRNESNNFIKCLQWSPDGSYLTSLDNQRNISFYTATNEGLTRVLNIHESDNVYDMQWYPGMNVSDPSTCCILTSARDHPIRLWDICTAKVCCSYPCYNHLDQIIAPHSLHFDSGGSWIFAGFDKSCLRVINVQRPGQVFRTARLKSYLGNRSGIISTMDMSSTASQLLALGTFGGGVCVLDVRQDICKPIAVLEATGGTGVTCVKFSSSDGNQLLVGSRKHDKISLWDIRQLNSPLLQELYRPIGSTNQRSFFNVRSSDSALCSGTAVSDCSSILV